MVQVENAAGDDEDFEPFVAEIVASTASSSAGPAGPLLSPTEVINRRLGLMDIGHQLFSTANLDSPVGRVEWIHGSSLSVKAICYCASHAAPEAGMRHCHLVLHANLNTMEKYERACEWLLAYADNDRGAHIALADQLKRDYAGK